MHPVGTLSGGERARLMLARALARSSKMLAHRPASAAASLAAVHDDFTTAEDQWLTLALRREEIKAV